MGQFHCLLPDGDKATRFVDALRDAEDKSDSFKVEVEPWVYGVSVTVTVNGVDDDHVKTLVALTTGD